MGLTALVTIMPNETNDTVLNNTERNLANLLRWLCFVLKNWRKTNQDLIVVNILNSSPSKCKIPKNVKKT